MTTATETLSFFGSPALKEAVRARVARHQELDQIVQGTYTKVSPDGDGRVIGGCFIGCSLHSGTHAEFPRLLGLPEWYGRLGEAIFERLPRGEHLTFPLEVYEATPVGVDLSPVRDQFLVWVLTETLPAAGTSKHTVQAVLELLKRRLRGDEPTMEEWLSARAAAGDANAAAAVAYAYAYAYTDAAAYAYAYAYVAAAAYVVAVAYADDDAAAAADDDAAAYVAAYRGFVQRARAKFVELLRAATPVEAPPYAETLPVSDDFCSFYTKVKEEAAK